MLHGSCNSLFYHLSCDLYNITSRQSIVHNCAVLMVCKWISYSIKLLKQIIMNCIYTSIWQYVHMCKVVWVCCVLHTVCIDWISLLMIGRHSFFFSFVNHVCLHVYVIAHMQIIQFRGENWDLFVVYHHSETEFFECNNVYFVWFLVHGNEKMVKINH